MPNLSASATGRPVTGPSSAMSQRVVSLWLPDWPLMVHARAHGAPPEARPFALVERGRHGLTLACVNHAARAAGLRVGQRHADASAMQPALQTSPADRDADRAALERLARWCWRWTPSVALDWRTDGLAGLFLDISGAAHLFGGEGDMLRDIRTRLAAADISVRAALADTPGAAWGLARFSGRGLIRCRTGATAERCAGLPLAALRLDATLLADAQAMGLRRIGDLTTMPRSGLARRFRSSDGLELVERLDQLHGDAPEALVLIAAPPRHTVRRAFAEPVTDTDIVAALVPALAAELAASLAADGQGALALELTAFRCDGGTAEIAVRLSLASRRTALWLRLFSERGFERLDLGFGIDAVRLSASAFGPVPEGQEEMLAAPDDPSPLLELCDRLKARLGNEVCVGTTRDSWMPERAEIWRPVAASPAPVVELDRERPLLLLDPPEPIDASFFEVPEGAPARFRWRRVERRVSRAEGPERLSPEWWRNPHRPRRTRDYYRVEDDTGARFWLFREGLYGWEDADRPPTWWLHGLFA